MTKADKAAERAIRERLAALGNRFPIVGEEEGGPKADPDAPLASMPFWLLDPLDGTNGFIRGSDNFTVNIALIHGRKPILGVVYAPAYRDCYAASQPVGALCSRQDKDFHPIAVPSLPPRSVRALISTTGHKDQVRALLQPTPVRSIEARSSSIKFCHIAEGKEDVYIRIGTTNEWDTAAGQAVLEIAGGVMSGLDGKEFLYGKTTFQNPHFVAAGHASIRDCVIRNQKI